jgi:hypothetical protein
MPKIFIITLLSQHASESTSHHSGRIYRHCSFLFSRIIQPKECKTKEDLLENNTGVKSDKT